jgi:hypothetical protein
LAAARATAAQADRAAAAVLTVAQAAQPYLGKAILVALAQATQATTKDMAEAVAVKAPQARLAA